MKFIEFEKEAGLKNLKIVILKQIYLKCFNSSL